MEESVSVSIIIPVYNEEKYLAECLNSVCGQTFRDIEIICIDDESTDSSLSILEQYAEKDERIKTVRLPQKMCLGGARNAGIDIARGKYIWFIDADDVIDLDAVEVLFNKMEELENVDMLMFNADAFRITESDEREQVPQRYIERKWPKNQKLRLPEDAALVPSLIGTSCVTYFTRHSFITPYRFRKGVFFEDAYFTFSLLSSNGIFYEIEYAPYHRRVSQTSITGSGDIYPPKHLKDRIIAMQDIAGVIKRKKLPEQYFSVVWFKKYARYFIGKYVEQDISDPIFDRTIEKLQREWDLFKKSPLKFKRANPVIVAMYANSAQIDRVSKRVNDLLEQYFVPDKIILGFSSEQFPFGKNELPAEILNLTKKEVEINCCDATDYSMFFLQTLEKNPDATIIAAGDADHFPENWLSELYKAYQEEPCIHCSRAKKLEISINNKYFIRKGVRVNGEPPRFLNKPELTGYVLYPAHYFDAEIFDRTKIMAQASVNTDLLIWLMGVQKGYKVKADAVNEEDTDEQYLYSEENWSALETVLKDYPFSEWRLRDENNKEMQSREMQKQLDSTKKQLDSNQKQLESTKKQLDSTQKQLNDANDETVRLEREIENIQSTWSYRIGRKITAIPRKIRGFIS